MHFSRYQEQARKDIAVVTQRVHRILLDVGKVRCLWINPHLYFFSFPTFLNVHGGFYLSRAGSFFLMKLELCVKVLALHGGQDLYVYLWIFDLFVWALLRTIARLFVFLLLLLFAYLLNPLIIFQSTDSISDSEIRLFCK